MVKVSEASCAVSLVRNASSRSGRAVLLHLVLVRPCHGCSTLLVWRNWILLVLRRARYRVDERQPEQQLDGRAAFVLVVAALDKAARSSTHRLQLEKVTVEGRKNALRGNCGTV